MGGRIAGALSMDGTRWLRLGFHQMRPAETQGLEELLADIPPLLPPLPPSPFVRRVRLVDGGCSGCADGATAAPWGLGMHPPVDG